MNYLDRSPGDLTVRLRKALRSEIVDNRSFKADLSEKPKWESLGDMGSQRDDQRLRIHVPSHAEYRFHVREIADVSHELPASFGEAATATMAGRSNRSWT